MLILPSRKKLTENRKRKLSSAASLYSDLLEDLEQASSEAGVLGPGMSSNYGLVNIIDLSYLEDEAGDEEGAGGGRGSGAGVLDETELATDDPDKVLIKIEKSAPASAAAGGDLMAVAAAVDGDGAGAAAADNYGKGEEGDDVDSYILSADEQDKR